jgi:DNA polymerase-3 subunit gamma/tau
METSMPPARASFAPSSSARSAPETSAMRQPVAPQAEAPATPQLRLSSFPEIVALAAERRDLAIKAALENDVRLVRLEDGRLEVALEPNAPRSLVNDLSRKLELWTGRRWTVIVSNAAAQPTLRAQAQAQQNELETAVQADPRVQDVMAKWPGAKIETVRRTPQAQNDADLPEPPADDED